MAERTPEQVKEDLRKALAKKTGNGIVSTPYPTWLGKEEKQTFTHQPQIPVDPWLENHRSSLKQDNYKRG